MWRAWGSNRVKILDTSFSPSPPSLSFKDVKQLVSEEDTYPPPPSSPVLLRKSFNRVRLAASILRSWSRPPNDEVALPPGAEARVVLYYTSLRVVRPTFEDCRAVRSILRSFRVSLDERDLAMDSSFLLELTRIFGVGVSSTQRLSLPRVFIGGRYVGGADEIRLMHELGELKCRVECLPVADDPSLCPACAGFRFVVCDECSGSHKVYEDKLGFRTCSLCNENGLLRCPSCSSPPLL